MSGPTVCLIGFGEVGQVLAEDLAKAGVTAVSTFDIAFAVTDSRPSRALSSHAVKPAATAAEAAAGAELVISAVTAAQDVAAAQSVSAGLAPSAFFLDLNSASPGAKQASAAIIEQAGGRYVEAAVMSPIGPKRIASPMLLGGPHAEGFVAFARPLGFTGATPFSDVVGKASAAKLCRSIMVKGMEALLTESMLAARRYGVEDTVLASLTDLMPLPNWPELARYMISRSLEHGRRRAEEMLEAARTVDEAAIEPLMSRAIVERQNWAAAHSAALATPDLWAMLDAIIEETTAA